MMSENEIEWRREATGNTAEWELVPPRVPILASALAQWVGEARGSISSVCEQVIYKVFGWD